MPPTAVRNPPNPWHSTEVEFLGEPPRARLQVFTDATRGILAHNDSPDVGFDWSVNPYRGCLHGCAYCYARPSHQYLDFGAGSDFERKIVVKPEAPALLRAAFDRPKWRGELVMFSGVTDCYQPLEATYRLTRGCLEVCAEYRNPAAVITKSPLVVRDIDVLQRLRDVARVSVSISIPFWDEAHARAIEPWVPSPARRMRAVEALASAGIDVGVNVAPVIPGLGDQEMPRVLEAAAQAGAKRASMIMLRLPGPVRQVFEQRVREALPLRAERILSRIRDTRGGRLNDPRFGARMRGEGAHAQATQRLFEATCDRLGLLRGWSGVTDEPTTFERPPRAGDQLGLW